jgi:hypothetical protein
MLISGCIIFRTKKEKLQVWKELKQEFGDKVEIFIESHNITYTCTVDRNFI